MSVIIVPSKKIYSTNYEKISNGKISSVIQSFYKPIKKTGVVSKEYTFNFASIDTETDMGDIRYLYESPVATEGFQFSIDTNTTTDTATYIQATIGISLSQLCDFKVTKQKLESHQLKHTFRMAVKDNGKYNVVENTSFSNPTIDTIDKDGEFGTVVIPFWTLLESDNIIVLSVTVSLVGDYTIFSEKEVTVGESSKNFRLDSSEIVQNENNNNYANDIVFNWANGLETAEIVCSVGKYYDEKNNIVITTESDTKMLIEIGDTVVPMRKSGDGYDIPIAVTQDGLAKTFCVGAQSLIYDGSVLQKLTVIENGSVNLARTTYTTIGNKAGGLTYKVISNQIRKEPNEAGGITYIIGE